MSHSMPSSSASRPSDSPWAAGRTRGEAVKVGVRWLEWGRGTEPRHWEMEMAMKDRKKLIIGVVAGGLMMPDRHRYSMT
jgi:hypothetical protein